MKKFYSLFLLLSFCFIRVMAQIGGPTCATAALFPVALPFSALAESTCGMGNDYNSGNTTVCGDPKYMNGEDKLYEFTPAMSGTVLIIFSSSTPGDDAAGLFVFKGCPDVGICIANNTTVTPNKNIGVTVTAGTTYYVVVDDTLDCITAYSISISAPDPSCPKLLTSAPNFAPNMDFEQGNFNKWKGFTGNCCPINTPTNGIVAGRHTIVSGAGTDPNTGGKVTLVAPGGGKRSARLGNNITGAQGERLSYTFAVTPQTNGIIYKYAIVLQDPGHAEAEQPRFEVVVKDANNNAVSCGTYKVTASPNIPCFEAFNDVVFKDWTTVGIDLTPYMGKNITIEYSTGDCSQGGHYGYAYVDVAATKLQIEIINGNFCNGDDSLTLKAPDGFDGYLWSNGATTQSIKIGNVTPGDSFQVTLTPVQGFLCSSTLTIVIPDAPTVTADFTSDNNLCESDTFQFTDLSTFTPADAIISNWYWDFGDGNTSNIQHPEHLFASDGVYNVRLIVKNKVGCLDTMIRAVTVLKALDQPVPICQSTTTNSVTFKWNTVTDATGYEVSLDGGMTWITPSSGSAGTTHVENGLIPNQAVTLLVRALGPPPCDKSQPSDPATCITGECAPIVITCNNDTTITQGDSVILQATAQGGNGNYVYTWTPATVGTGPGPHTVKPDSTTTYYVTVTSGTDSTCPPAYDTIVVNISCNGMSANLVLGADSIAQGQSTTIQANVTGGSGSFSYAWTPDLGTGPGPYTISPDTTTTYSVTVTDLLANASCPTVVSTVTLPVYCNGITGLTLTADSLIKKGESTVITLNMQGGNGPFVYTWTPDIGTGAGPHTVQPDSTTLYTVLVEDQGKSGCPSRTDDILITVYEDAEPATPEDAYFHLPNAFTPNSDGDNDGFKAIGKGITDYNMKVYNRWGEMVFTTRNIDEAWNGHKNNDPSLKLSPVGVYIYVVKVRVQDSKTKTYYGTVSLTDKKD